MQEILTCDNYTLMHFLLSYKELQLAALLGKTLLGKNEELEVKLRRLQEFAEETLAANQVMPKIPT